MDHGFQIEAMEKGAFDFALDLEHGQRGLGSVFDEGDKNKHDHGDADLSHDGIQRGTQKGFYFQVLFDPFEEQLHLPATFVQPSDGAGRPREMVRKEDIHLSVLRVDIPNAAEDTRIGLFGLATGQPDDLIGGDALFPVGSAAFDDPIADLCFQPGDEESPLQIHIMEKNKVRVRAVHQKHTVFLRRMPSDHGQIVRFSIGHDEHRGNGVAMIILHMEFDGPFGLAKLGPVENTQTQFDHGRVPSTNVVSDARRSTRFHVLELPEKRMEQPHIDFPRPPVVRIRQGGAMNVRHPCMIVGGAVRVETGLQVSQAVAAGDLPIQHGTELIPTRKTTNTKVPFEPANDFREKRPGQKGCQLSKHCITMGHGLWLLFMGVTSRFFRWYTVVYRSPKPFLIFPRPATKTVEISEIRKHVHPSKLAKSKKCGSSRLLRLLATLRIPLETPSGTYPQP